MPVHSIWDIPSIQEGSGSAAYPDSGSAYSSTGQIRRASVWSHGVYHEQQEGMMCAVHAINNMLQGPVVNEVQLAEIGRDCDAAERRAMADGGVDTPEYVAFIRGGSNNVREDGFFGIQVIQRALQNLGLEMIRLGHSDDGSAMRNPAAETGYILNRNEHWFTVRKIGSYWFDLNSTNAAPKFVSNTYISMFLTQLKAEGFSVFVVQGAFPNISLENNPEALAQAVAAHRDSSDAKTWEGARPTELEARGQTAFNGKGYTLSGGATGRSGGEYLDEDPELALAIAASLAQDATTPPSTNPDSLLEQATQRLPAEPAAGGATITELVFRLPDGRRLQRRFEAQRNMQDAFDYLMIEVSTIHPADSFSLVAQYPRRQFNRTKDSAMSFEAAGLTPNAVLNLTPL